MVLMMWVDTKRMSTHAELSNRKDMGISGRNNAATMRKQSMHHHIIISIHTLADIDSHRDREAEADKYEERERRVNTKTETDKKG